MENLIRTTLFVLLVYQILPHGNCHKRYRFDSLGFNGKIINELVNVYLNASHTYMTLDTILCNVTHDLHEVKAFFRTQSHEKRDQAIKLIEYQELKGGKIRIKDNQGFFLPPDASKKSVLDGAFNMEKEIRDIIQIQIGKAWENGHFEISLKLIGHLEMHTIIMDKMYELFSKVDLKKYTFCL